MDGVLVVTGASRGIGTVTALVNNAGILVPLAAALAAGTAIEYAVVEFDKYGGDIFEGIEGSYAYLSSILSA